MRGHKVALVKWFWDATVPVHRNDNALSVVSTTAEVIWVSTRPVIIWKCAYREICSCWTTLRPHGLHARVVAMDDSKQMWGQIWSWRLMYYTFAALIVYACHWGCLDLLQESRRSYCSQIWLLPTFRYKLLMHRKIDAISWIVEACGLNAS